MGNKTSGPNTDKKIYTGSNGRMNYICCEMQGWREYMEDASLCIIDHDEDSSLFGVFDGHGGPLISKFAACNFRSIFSECYSQYKDKGVENSLIQSFIKLDELLFNEDINDFLKKQSTNNSADFSFNIKNYLKIKSKSNNSSGLSISEKEKDSFAMDKLKSITSVSNNSGDSTGINPDTGNKNTTKDFYSGDSKEGSGNRKTLKANKFRKDKDYVAYYMGTTANIVYIENNYIYVSNVGDSYSVMFKNGQAIKLNSEHKTCINAEEERIRKAGFKVINSRVDGKLNLTRAIGKFI
jgi:serine/threonine protein phosphatase PrpC